MTLLFPYFSHSKKKKKKILKTPKINKTSGGVTDFLSPPLLRARGGGGGLIPSYLMRDVDCEYDVDFSLPLFFFLFRFLLLDCSEGKENFIEEESCCLPKALIEQVRQLSLEYVELGINRRNRNRKHHR